MRSHHPESQECGEWGGLRASEQLYVIRWKGADGEEGGCNSIPFYNGEMKDGRGGGGGGVVTSFSTLKLLL